MKFFLKILLVFLLFFAQTAFPINTHLFSVNLSPVISYLVATTFVLPFTESLTILTIILVLYYLTGAVFALPTTILLIFIFLAIYYIRRLSLGTFLSYAGIFFTIIIFHFVTDVICFLPSSLEWSQFGSYLIHFTSIVAIAEMAMATLFIAILSFSQRKKV